MNDSRLFYYLIGAGLFLLVELMLSIFLAAETALSRIALHRMANENPEKLGFLERLRNAPSTHRAAALLLRQTSLLGAVLLLSLGLRATGWRVPMIGAVVFGVLLGALVLESVFARALALWDPRRAVRFTAPLVRAANFLLFPLVKPLHALMIRIHRRRQQIDEEREEEQEEEVEALIEVGEREGLLEAEEGEMMRGIVDLDEKLVREIMTPRTDIIALAAETPAREARRTLLDAGHSRLPVFHGSIDNVVGVLHLRDLFQAWDEKHAEQSIGRFIRPATFVPETLSAGELLSEMRQKTPIAIVVDEYGGTAGIVTLEDLLEEIVGEIRDEHDEEEELVRKEAAGVCVVNAVAHVDELEPLFGVEFEERDFDTVGGLVVSSFGRVPLEGESVVVGGLRIEVLKADQRRVHVVRVRRETDAGDGDSE